MICLEGAREQNWGNGTHTCTSTRLEHEGNKCRTWSSVNRWWSIQHDGKLAQGEEDGHEIQI